MYKSFKPLPTAFAKLSSNRVHRYAGDVANDGKGEILVIGPMREWEQNLLATSAKAPVSIAKRKAKTRHLKAVA